MIENQKRIDDNIFLRNVINKKTNTIESKYIDGLFSRSRDSLHQREIQVIDEMLMNKLIEVENYYLCDNIYYKEYMKYDYTSDFEEEFGIKDLYIFEAYRQEHTLCSLSKYAAFEHFKKDYDIEWDRNDESFYVKELNLLVVYENQRIIDFIDRCLNKDINLAVISDYTDNEEHKLAIRYIKPKYKIMEAIYPEGSLYYNSYTNNFMDVLDRYNLAKNFIRYIMIERDISNISDKNKPNIKSCAICKNLSRFGDDSIINPYRYSGFYYNILNDELHAIKLCTERDSCKLNREEFDIHSNDIKCSYYEELTIPCANCKTNTIPYTKYHFEDTKFCSNDCKVAYDEWLEREKLRREKLEKEFLEGSTKLKLPSFMKAKNSK